MEAHQGWNERLFAAVSGDDCAEVRRLLKEGADPNARKPGGRSPLMLAARNGSADLLRLLVDAGADLNARDEEGETALDFAAFAESDEKVKLLLMAGADASGSGQALCFAARTGHRALLEALLKAGADVNGRDSEGKTALFYAVSRDDPALVKTLLDAGADPNLRDQSDQTALFLTSDLHLVKALLDAGADVNAGLEAGWTALTEAARKGDLALAKALIAAGADLNGTPALIQAAWIAKSLEMVRLLLSSGADVNVRDRKRGKTALMRLVSERAIDQRIVEALLAAPDIDVNLKDFEGRTALFDALRGPLSLVRALIAAGADVNATDGEGKTALMRLMMRVDPPQNDEGLDEWGEVLEAWNENEAIREEDAEALLQRPPRCRRQNRRKGSGGPDRVDTGDPLLQAKSHPVAAQSRRRSGSENQR